MFETIARHGSFMHAAQKLHVTYGAASQQIRQLEALLGVDLFERRNQVVFLMPADDQLHAVTTDAFKILTDSTDRIAHRAISSTLVVSCRPMLAMWWLIPRLSCFQVQHPAIQVYLFTADGPIGFARTGVDVALHRNDFTWSVHVHAALIRDEWVGPVHAHQTDITTRRWLLHTVTRPNA